MKKFLIFPPILLFSIIVGKPNQWNYHSAHIILEKRIEIGLFQPLRYGLKEDLEFSIYPTWFFVVPNISFKKSHQTMMGFKVGSRFSTVYPTPLLNLLSKKGIGGLIDPNITMPPMLGISATMLMSKNLLGTMTTLKGGVDIGLVMGKLDTRSNIDLPIIYHRLEIFYNKWGIHTGIDVTKNISERFKVLVDLDLRLLPEIDQRKADKSYQMHSGNYSIEHKFLLIYNMSSVFRVITGYKLVAGEFPYGKEVRLLPYIPVLEKWIPIIELQWSIQL